MQIDLQNIDKENFNVTQSQLRSGEVVYLIVPKHMGTSWTEETLHFRSLLVNSDGQVISSGLKKFFNWGEQPNIHPVPTSLKGCEIIEKLDGSLLTVSRYKGEFIARTRGTVLACDTLNNGEEIEHFKLKYPKVFSADKGDTWDHSLIFEWTTPTNKIILSYGDEPELHLIGCISHTDFSLTSQVELNSLADQLGVRRPKTYSFDSLQDCLKVVEDFKGLEGICLYSKNGQRIHKIKSAHYLALHRMKSNLSSIDKVVDVFYEIGKPTYVDFYDYIANNFDFELAEYCRGHMSKIVDANKEVQKIIASMYTFLEERVMPLTSRKEQAMVIIQDYRKTNRSSFLFHMLDGNELNNDQEKKLMFQVIAR